MKTWVLIIICLIGASGIAINMSEPRDWNASLALQLNAAACNTAPMKISSLENSDIYIGNNNSNCVIWNNAFHDIDVMSFSRRDSIFNYPIVVYYHNSLKKTDLKNVERVFIRLVGGPAGNISPQRRDSFYTQFIRKNDIMISPAYFGTEYISSYPKPDFNNACRQIGRLIKSIQENFRNSKVVIIGESLGGPIGACAARISKVSRVILVSPLARSPKELLVFYKGMFTKEADQEVNIRTFSKKDGQLHWHNIKSYKVLSAFFDKNQTSIDLKSRIYGSDNQFLILYGKRDAIINTNSIEKIIRSKLKNTVSYGSEGVGHMYLDQKNLEKPTEYFGNFLDATN